MRTGEQIKQVELEIKGMTKTFGPTVALDNVSVSIHGGEVYGLIGENGSGKSTLSSIIAGIQPADSGEMTLDGAPYKPESMLDAQAHSIAMIVQEMGSIPHILVADNIFVGKERRFRKGLFVNKKEMYAEAKKALENIGVYDIAPDAPINSLSFEDRKIVEIARAMYEQPRLLIVDETTTALSQRGRDVVYALMEKQKNEGKAVIFISHDLDEVMTVCTRLTVLRDGKLIGTLTREEMEPDLVRTMMVGREFTGDYYRSDYDGSFGKKVVMRAEKLSGVQVESLDLELHEGEILGIGGLTDSGIHEIGRLFFGIDKPILGQVTFEDGTVSSHPRVAVSHGVGYASKNRDQEALMLRASVEDNIVLPSLVNLRNSFRLVPPAREKALSMEEIELLRIKCSSGEQQVSSLSGGNKQKVVFGKWIGNNSRILILDCPTRGVDIGVKSAMYDLIYKLKQEGRSIMLISEELPELIGMSDRIVIIKDGRLSGEHMRSPDLTEHDLIHEMI